MASMSIGNVLNFKEGAEGYSTSSQAPKSHLLLCTQDHGHVGIVVSELVQPALVRYTSWEEGSVAPTAE